MFGYTITGEMDMTGADELLAGLMVATEATSGDLVVDCRTMTFIDAAALSRLVEVSNRLEQDGRHLRLRGVRSSFRHVFEISGLPHLLDDDTTRAKRRGSLGPRGSTEVRRRI